MYLPSKNTDNPHTLPEIKDIALLVGSKKGEEEFSGTGSASPLGIIFPRPSRIKREKKNKRLPGVLASSMLQGQK